MGVKIREKKKGEWWLIIHHNSKRKTVKVGTKTAANKLKRKVEAELAAGKLQMNKVKSFGYYCNRWMNEVMPSTCKESTQTDYVGIVNNHLKKASFWDVQVDQISEADIEEFLIAIRSKKARSTTVHIKNVISNSFKRAVKARAIRINPARGVEIPRAEQTFEAHPYSRAEIELLLDTCRELYPEHYVMMFFFCRTGCRAGEVAGLQWKEIDLESRKATIRRGVVRGQLIETTKSKRIRKVDLTPALVTALREHRIKTGPGKFVFRNKAGSWIDMDNFRSRVFTPLCAAAGLHKTRIHDLRHSYAAAVIVATKDIYYAQRQLGHASIETTVNTYGHWLEEDKEVRPVDVLDSAFG